MRSTLRRVALIGMAGFGLALTSVGAAGASTATTAAPNAQDRAWLIAAHQSNLTEIAAGDLVTVFRRLFDAGFPIERMRISSAAALNAPATGDGNTTEVFACRPVRGHCSPLG